MRAMTSRGECSSERPTQRIVGLGFLQILGLEDSQWKATGFPRWLGLLAPAPGEQSFGVFRKCEEA